MGYYKESRFCKRGLLIEFDLGFTLIEQGVCQKRLCRFMYVKSNN